MSTSTSTARVTVEFKNQAPQTISVPVDVARGLIARDANQFIDQVARRLVEASEMSTLDVDTFKRITNGDDSPFQTFGRVFFGGAPLPHLRPDADLTARRAPITSTPDLDDAAYWAKVGDEARDWEASCYEKARANGYHVEETPGGYVYVFANDGETTAWSYFLTRGSATTTTAEVEDCNGEKYRGSWNIAAADALDLMPVILLNAVEAVSNGEHPGCGWKFHDPCECGSGYGVDDCDMCEDC